MDSSKTEVNPLMTTTIQQIRGAVNRERLLDTAFQLCSVYSPTRSAGKCADRLAEILQKDGFQVERGAFGWEPSPAVITKMQGMKPGKTLQFDGHLDTVHLPFVAPQVQGDRLTGSGSSDMKAGLAAAVEAVRVLRELDLIQSGSVMLTAHDLHEAPWGDSGQLDEMIRSGVCGDAVMIPEYTHDVLPIVGRGNAVIKFTVRRPGQPIHEVFRPTNETDVLLVTARLLQKLSEWNLELNRLSDPVAGCETVFVGQMHGGEIFNQYPSTAFLEGTRRWLPGHTVEAVKKELEEFAADFLKEVGTSVEFSFQIIRDSFILPSDASLIGAFQDAYQTVTGTMLPTGNKPFADDGSGFWQIRKIPTITHGPRASGAHTMNEWVSISDLERVATVYALTAVNFCEGN